MVPPYQLALRKPGISPLYARFLKQILQMPYLRSTACGLPQMEQRVYSLVENFCFLCCLLIKAFLAIVYLLLCGKGHAKQLEQLSGFLVGFGRCDKTNIKTSDLFYLIIRNLREDQLFFDAEA
jgi:hypothetical protein